MGLLSGLLGDNYVTGVLNDYSTVQKATFTLIEVGSNITNPNSAKYKTVPVQINPSDLVYQYSHSTRDITGGLNEASGETSYDSSYGNEASLGVTLYYDFYDEYQARTANGAMGFMDSFHLMSEKFSSLQALIDHVSKYKKPRALFRWGSQVSFYGVLESINPTYRAFSQWGHPLKGEVSVNIQRDRSANALGFKAQAESDAGRREKFTKFMNMGMLGAGLALR